MQTDNLYNSTYFENRGVEWKDEIMSCQWFEFTNPHTVFEYGAGQGKVTHIAKYNGLFAEGFDPYVPQEQVFGLAKGHIKPEFPSIENGSVKVSYKYDLVTCVDVFEHLSLEKDVDEAIERIKSIAGKWVVFSITDLSLWDVYKDETHKFCRTRKWWENKLSQHFKLREVPTHWLYKNQLYLCEIN